MAEQNVSQRINTPSMSAAHQTVNPRATSTAEAVGCRLLPEIRPRLFARYVSSSPSVDTACRTVALETGSSSSPAEENREIASFYSCL
jgi:hypothetical protein